MLQEEGISVRVNAVTSHRWHERLGHPSVDKIKSLDSVLASNKVHNTNTCCIFAKQKRLPFVSKNNVSDVPFQLIHCDIWGSYHIPSHKGHRYFITIVDDCTRYTWIYLITHKSETQIVIPQFFKINLKQFDKHIKMFRPNNAKELQFVEFFKLHRILH